MANGIGEALDSAWSRLAQTIDIQSAPNPQLLQVVLILFGGFVLGRIVSDVVLRLLKRTSLDEMGVKSDIQLILRRFNYHGALSDFVSDVIRWAVYALALLAVFNLFGSELVSGYSQIAIDWAWRLVLAIFLVIVGVLISERIGSIVVQVVRAGRISGLVDESNAEIPLYIVVGKMVAYVGYLITFIITLGFLGIDTTVIHILVAILGIGIAAAFIVSSRHLLANIAISVYFQGSHMFRGGEHVRIGEYSGEIIGIRPLYTKIRSEGETYYIPNTTLISNVIEYTGEGE